SLFDYPTPALLQDLLKHAASVTSESLHSEQVLAPNQLGLWLFEQTNPNNAGYNIPYSIRLKGAKSISYIQQAVQAIVDKHLPLRSCFPVVNGLPTLHIKEQL